MLKDAENIDRHMARRSTSKRGNVPYVEYLILTMRKRVETTFSEISDFFPKTIHAVTEYGSILKVVIFIVGYTLLKTVL
jgi:hypothetical protein